MWELVNYLAQIDARKSVAALGHLPLCSLQLTHLSSQCCRVTVQDFCMPSVITEEQVVTANTEQGQLQRLKQDSFHSKEAPDFL